MSLSAVTSGSETEQGQVFQNFIAGKWQDSRSGETFTSTNPARTSEVIGSYQKSTAADLEDAIDAAVEAQPGWRRRLRLNAVRCCCALRCCWSNIKRNWHG